MLLDGGSFRDMIGRDAEHLVVNARVVEEFPVQTAGGVVWLNQVGNIVLGHHVLYDCIINPHMSMSLISEGMLALTKGWRYVTDASGKQIRDPAGHYDYAYRRGVLFYMPASMMCTEHDGLGYDHTMMAEMDNFELAKFYYTMMAQLAEGTSVDAQGEALLFQVLRSNGKKAEAAGLPHVAYNDESDDAHRENGDATKIPDEEFGQESSGQDGQKQTKKPNKEAQTHYRAKEALTETRTHLESGHRTKLRLKKEPCDGCIKASMLDRYSRKGGSNNKLREYEAVNADTLDYGTADNNGQRYGLNVVVVNNSYGQIVLTANKDAASSAATWGKCKARIESNADPGARNNYKIERRYTDPGKEFEGASRKACEKDKVRVTLGMVNEHTSGALVENRNKMLQRTGTALSATALSDESMHGALHGEAARHASELMNHSAITTSQKHAKITAYEEHTGKLGASAEYLKVLG